MLSEEYIIYLDYFWKDLRGNSRIGGRENRGDKQMKGRWRSDLEQRFQFGTSEQLEEVCTRKSS